MFEFIHDINAADAISGVHFALRRISYRGPETPQSEGLITETEPTTVDEKIGLKILKEIVTEENAPLEKLSEAKAQKYKQKLLDLADELSEYQVDYDKEKALGVLREWEKTPFDETGPDFMSMPLSSGGVILLSTYLILFTLGLLFLIFKLWPRWSMSAQYWNPGISIFGLRDDLDIEVRLILIAAGTGGLGSLVRALTSFAEFVGSRKLVSSWTLWYVTRPFMGMATALVFYFILRATSLLGSPPQTMNKFFLIAALSSFVGMFSDQLTIKLGETFSVVFKSRVVRPDRLVNIGPSITSITPATGPTTGGTAVNITGYDLQPNASVIFGGVPATAVTFIDITSIDAVAPPHAAGVCDVDIVNPDGQKATQHRAYAYV